MPHVDYDRILAEVEAAMQKRDIDRFLVLISPRVDFIPLLAGVEGGGAWRGHAGIRRWLEGLFEAWEGYDPRFRLVEENGEGGAIFAIDVDLRGRESGVAVTRKMFQAIEFDEDGLASWWRYFDEIADARAALAERASERS